MNVPMLVEKPRDYTVRFEFLSRDDGEYAAIGANDAAFGYETAAATEDQSGGDGDDAGQRDLNCLRIQYHSEKSYKVNPNLRFQAARSRP